MSKKITLDKTKGEIRQVVCRRCDNTTNHTVCSSAEFSWDFKEADIQGIDKYEIIRCQGCDDISFRVASSNSEDVAYDEDGEYINPESETLYPNRLMGRTLLPDEHILPRKIKSIYLETHKAISGNLKILAGIGIRALIDAVCAEENAQGDSLEQKVDDLITKGILTKGNASVLHQTRVLGNRAAHEAEAPQDDELEIAFDIAENLLETVYIIPKKAKRLDRKTEKSRTTIVEPKISETLEISPKEWDAMEEIK
ncbi:MAG: hypothetical protein A2942_01695 [Candidatus Lloydbacteria bacterium RIFCSPLOWO2_01_FULL_50_20]|uniref:DUF4145 domain-containing protein n=1 Tax=Candidatus Lloydbacteria bacterium RIFCSPLOWO2_01_FULL_50_20 TaxID=1798665 RepID=A0A1G2DH89_9BACT|nr:MAG: hypothetical protein A2942_01695 [Candidatus Lloydbacteria bacterium RIFCSPLOWO2_01_FULL_50_20]